MGWMVVARPGTKVYKPYYRTAKRIIEVILCLLVLPILAPLFLLIVIAIRLDSPGPILFTQQRVGKGGRAFKIIKFRTMYENIDSNSHRIFMKAFVNGKVTQQEEDRGFKAFKPHQVTQVGHMLRKTSLDELPQLINVLKGEMSLVGPRPNVLWEVEEYRGWHNERLEVLPGITGLAQVRGRSNILFDEIVQYDIEYLRKQSLSLDMKILWWTILSLVSRKGAH